MRGSDDEAAADGDAAAIVRSDQAHGGGAGGRAAEHHGLRRRRGDTATTATARRGAWSSPLSPRQRLAGRGRASKRRLRGAVDNRWVARHSSQACADVANDNRKTMAYFAPAYLEHERKRWMRPDAHRYVRPDWRRWVKPGYEAEYHLALFGRKYSSDQPRVPAGNPDGGQWTGGGGGGRNDPRILSDATPDPIKPGAQYAQSRPRAGAGFVTINGQEVEPTPGQAARLAVAQARAQDSIARVRALDPSWRPSPSAYSTVEGLIRSYEADAEQAQGRASDLARVGIGPGPFAGESIPARGPERNFTVRERNELNDIGRATGCHTCGTMEPGTTPGNFVPDHQPPSALNSVNRPQRLYPQCLTCSLRQGGWISRRGQKQ